MCDLSGMSGRNRGRGATTRRVCLAPFAPDTGGSVNALIADPRPRAPVPPILLPIEGSLFFDRDKFAESFAADLPSDDAASNQPSMPG